MALGFSFGTNKSTGKTVSDITKNEVTDQTQNQTQSQAQASSSTSSQSQTGQTSSTGTSSTNQAGTTTQAGTTSGSQAQTTHLFDDATLSGVQGAVAHLLQTIGVGSNAAAAGSSKLGAFDPTAFVADGVKAATATQQMGLDQSLNGMFDAIGGNDSTNSMATLLANRARGDMAANIAGVTSQLSGQAADIQRSNVLAGNTIDATSNQFLAQLLDALKGGEATTTGTTAQTQQQTGTTAQAGGTTTSESGATAQQGTSQTDTTAVLLNVLNTILHGDTNTVGTENSTTTDKKSGGGISLSI